MVVGILVILVSSWTPAYFQGLLLFVYGSVPFEGTFVNFFLPKSADKIPPLSQKQPAGLNRCTKPSGKLTWQNGKCTMNEAVFPIENGNNFIATLVYSSFKSFQVLSSPHLSEESIGKLAVWGGFGTD